MVAKAYFLVFICSIFANLAIASQTFALQNDTLRNKIKSHPKRVETKFLARQKSVTDSIITHTWVLPDSLLNKHALLDSVQKAYLFPTLDLLAWQQKYNAFGKTKNHYQLGNPRPKGNVIFLGIVLITLIIMAILKFSFAKQFTAIVMAFVSKRGLANINKEESLLNSWPLLLLFLLFGLILGMFLYLVARHYQLYQAESGLKFLFGASAFVMLLLGLKLIFLRLLGLLFNLQKPVNEYISILYLSYFNISLLFLPLIVAFALSPVGYANLYIALGCGLIALVFIVQVFRIYTTILSNNKFSKVHLLLYFCALEICPILILIKAIGM